MTVTLDLDENLVYALRERAMRAGLTMSEVVSDQCRSLLGARSRLPQMNILGEIRARVERGECDADIAGSLNYTVQRVGDLRRKMGLKPNRRVW